MWLLPPHNTPRSCEGGAAGRTRDNMAVHYIRRRTHRPLHWHQRSAITRLRLLHNWRRPVAVPPASVWKNVRGHHHVL
ncbi:hypothetical protein GDO78_020166 [Eleutherodactylus coqui]|uniref:Uncharacterized protein n=1 Tax=Eleutherodactylus coqui TaxID=57060 RepID=A0A8J6BK69_ELECQ|nr:hypothetical protein GDO78_020166 [Eleutherodactylus coqui]